MSISTCVYDNGQYVTLEGGILDPIYTPCILDFSPADIPQCQYQPADIIMSISHPWPRATGKYATRGPHYVALDIMFGPWAAYFPVSLCQGCNIVPLVGSSYNMIQFPVCRLEFYRTYIICPNIFTDFLDAFSSNHKCTHIAHKSERRKTHQIMRRKV